MINYNRRINVYLFSIFLIGGISGLLDNIKLSGQINDSTYINYNIGYFIGSGIGLLLFAILIGYIIYGIGLLFGIRNKDQGNINEILDDKLYENGPSKQQKIIKKFLPIKYAFYFSICFVVLRLISQLGALI